MNRRPQTFEKPGAPAATARRFEANGPRARDHCAPAAFPPADKMRLRGRQTLWNVYQTPTGKGPIGRIRLRLGIRNSVRPLHTINTSISASPKRQSVATGACITALGCAALSFACFALAVGQILSGRQPSISAFAVMVCTLPLTIICTIVAVTLVGPRRCRLAWIALGIFALQFITGFAVQSFLLSG